MLCDECQFEFDDTLGKYGCPQCHGEGLDPGEWGVDHQSWTVASLFSGSGNLDLGIKLAVPDARTILYVEREAYLCSTLVQRMEDGILDAAPVWGDVRGICGSDLRGLVDILLAGYPCQPFAITGRRQGDEDPRHLFPHVERLIREIEPPTIFLENVPGHLSLGGHEVIQFLQEVGYIVAAGIYSAEEVGGSHRRERLFIMAHRPGAGLPVIVRPEEGLGEEGRTFEQLRSELFPPGPGQLCEWDALLTQDIREAPAGSNAEVERTLRGAADGLANRTDRIMACGNGVVPLVAAYAFCCLAEAIEKEIESCSESS
jgi:DNA (cytosine-5)-methyltransferase 1